MDDETYILLLLSDSNLPTGSFVASSGLESYIKHGFSSARNHGSLPDPVVNFARDSLTTYARSALPFVSDAYAVVMDLVGRDGGVLDDVLDDIKALDAYYDTMTLNHVAKRASKSQGVALLTLYSKGFSRPSFLSSAVPQGREARLEALVDQFKLSVRREDAPGHLPVCWGLLAAALGLTLERAQYLHLFLHARSLLSAAVRLNTLGPYGAQQLLLHAIRPLVEAESVRCTGLRTGIVKQGQGAGFDDTLNGPATTWPLGEILAARHDLQHSRIFNS